MLTVGVPQKWDRSKKNLTYVRKAGVKQFISTFNRVKDLKGDELLWGDEVEYGIFHLDHAAKKIRLSLRAKQVCFDFPMCNEIRYLSFIIQNKPFYLICILWIQIQSNSCHSLKFDCSLILGDG